MLRTIKVYGPLKDFLGFSEIQANFKKFKKIQFFYKPHPASKLNLEQFDKIKIIKINSKNINKIDSKKIISLGATSSVVELKKKNNSVSVYVPPSSLDYSPTFNDKRYKKIYSYENLIEFLKI